MARATKSDRQAARHEAAHAVVAARLGLPLVYADIIEHGTGLTGFTSRSGRTKLGREADANPTACAIVGAAGIVGEREDRRRDLFVSFDPPHSRERFSITPRPARLAVRPGPQGAPVQPWAKAGTLH